MNWENTAQRLLAKIGSESGSAPAAALAWIGVTLLMLYGILSLAVGAHTQAKVQATADFAALSAADSIAAGMGTATPCAIAEQVANNNQMQLVRCTVNGLKVQVEVQTGVRVPLGGSIEIRGKAKAGPGQ